jgi:histidine kinase/DNA gyrase B/HSP90-like ATPase
MKSRLALNGKRPCLQRRVEYHGGADGLLIDATSLEWASPADLTAIAAMASTDVGNTNLALPNNPDVAQYLHRMGLTELVKEFGATVSGPNLTSVVNPLPDRLPEVRQLKNSTDAGIFASDVYKLVNAHAGDKCARIFHTMLGELLANTIHHAASPPGAFGAAQVHSGAISGRSGVEVSVADAGIGILKSLHKNPAYSQLGSSVEAIRIALHQGVTSVVGEEHRGDGLSRVAHQLHQHGGRLLLRSGDGTVRVSPGGRKFAQTGTSTPGTWAWLWISLAISPLHAEM